MSSATPNPPERPEPAAAHWAQIAEAGAITGMRFMFGCYKLGGRPLFRIMLAPVILYYFLAHGNARRASLGWIKRLRDQGALKGSSFWLGFRHFWQFGMALVDKLAVWKGDVRIEDVEVEGSDIIRGLLAEKRGAVLVISHLGNFEICRCLSSRHPQMRLTVMVHSKNSEKFNRFVREQIGHSHTELLQVTEISPATAMMLSERVERGEFVVIAGDRVPVNAPHNSLMADFFGEPAPFPAGPFTLAAILKVPMISVFCARDPALNHRYHIHFEWLTREVQVPRRQRPQFLQQLVITYARQLEAQCRRYPLQWFNFFDFWRQPTAPQQVTSAAEGRAETLADQPSDKA